MAYRKKNAIYSRDIIIFALKKAKNNKENIDMDLFEKVSEDIKGSHEG